MTKKILIGLKDEFLSRIYIDFFREEGFLVSTITENDNILDIFKKNTPDIILLDMDFAENNSFVVLKKIKESPLSDKVPIILISHSEDEEYRKKAIEFEVKDFLVGEYNSPLIISRRINVHLGGQKSYRISINDNEQKTKELAADLGYDRLSCLKCSSKMVMNLMKDSSKGKNYFKISFICPRCGK
ncbi:MAG: response regulator [Candidatus Pacebacteria bacterium]|nr:response regulator [Candidatus Paceibacterota bacterium]